MKRVLSTLCFLLLFIEVPSAFAFTDLTSTDDEEAIDYLYDEFIIDGYEDETYRPKNPINRAELLKLLVESRVEDVPTDGQDCFTDVSEEWYAKYVCYAKNEGWVEGYDDESFGPGKNINRAEALAMVFKVYSEEFDLLDADEEEGALYLDVSKEAWYADYLFTGKESGILEDKDYFYPANEITRGDTASVLYRLLMSLETDEEETENDSTNSGGSGSSNGSGGSGGSSSNEDEEEDVEPEDVVVNNPFTDATLYVNPYSDAYELIDSGVLSSQDSADLEQIAIQPAAKWFGDWNDDIEWSVYEYVSTVTESGALPVMVIYNIPGRDCGSYSAGGSSGSEAYLQWVQDFSDGVEEREVVVILEPDALALDCMFENSADLLAEAVTILKAKVGISVYLDAGHPNWTSAADMAERLTDANVEDADGFALNVSNFYTTEENIEYGEELSALIGDKHFLIDTSRNGNGWNGEWCNPSGMSLGQAPTVDTGEELVDAYLWVKPPGESDGTCNGGPSAGAWWLEYALDLVRN